MKPVILGMALAVLLSAAEEKTTEHKTFSGCAGTCDRATLPALSRSRRPHLQQTAVQSRWISRKR